MNENKSVIIKNTFYLTINSQYTRDVEIESSLSEEDSTYEITIGIKEGDYFKMNKNIFKTKRCFYIDASKTLTIKHFVAHSRVSVIRKIDEYTNSDVVRIGDDENDDLPFSEFERFSKSFPNSYEITKYLNARVDSILSDYFNIDKNYEEEYLAYLEKKIDKKTIRAESKTFKELELTKLVYVKVELEEMLLKSDKYLEKAWQNKIIQLLIFLMPKYIHVIDEVPFDDDYNRAKKYLDFLLVDYLGNVDLIEIKRPSDKSLMSKGRYRKNHYPLRELSGSVMQIEKYIYYLNKGGISAEEKIKKYLSNKRDIKTEISIVNPRGIIILGRDEFMNKRQKEDFEIVKRQYKNIADIMTYDDFLQRLITSIDQLKSD